jgi:hypothetical protein
MHLLTALPYHLKIADYFKQQPKTWDFFAAPKNKDAQLAELKADLLKNTYKFDETADAHLYEKARVAKEKLSLDVSITFYQAQYTDELNASIVYMGNEALIIFSGPIIKLLNEEELLAIIAHELAHVKLYSMKDGELEIADRIITSIANNYASEAVHIETAKLFKLYTEIFCDRGSYLVTGSINPIITSLVKIATGLDNINAENYIKQAEEIFASNKETKTEQLTHPENFIRARAIGLWHSKQDEAEVTITEMIEGHPLLDTLDLFQQKELSIITKTLLQLYLKPRWFQSTLVTSLARQYFTDYKTNETITLKKELVETIEKSHSSIKEYMAYILVDFALADESLEEVPLGWAFQLAEDIGLKQTFDGIIKKELQLSDKKLQQRKEDSLSAFQKVKENEGEQVYE